VVVAERCDGDAESGDERGAAGAHGDPPGAGRCRRLVTQRGDGQGTGRANGRQERRGDGDDTAEHQPGRDRRGAEHRRPYRLAHVHCGIEQPDQRIADADTEQRAEGAAQHADDGRLEDRRREDQPGEL